MQPTPPDWPRIAPALYYDDAAAAIDWLCEVFGFELRMRVDGEGGRVEHAELDFGDGMIMVGSAGHHPMRTGPQPWSSPRSVGGANTQCLCVYVDDADEHCARAKSAGAEILDEPLTDDYGEEYGANRSYRARDPEGHHWWFMTRTRAPKAQGS